MTEQGDREPGRGRPRRGLGWAALATGLAVCLAAGLGLVTKAGASSTVRPVSSTGGSAERSAGGSTGGSAQPDDSSSSTISGTTEGSSSVEAPVEFLDALSAALRSGDVAFLADRLNPAVITRYGAAPCRSSVATLTDSTAHFSVTSVSAPADFTWTTADPPRSTVVPDTVTVEATRVRKGQSTAVTIHISRVGDQFTWFTDCGAPPAG